MRNPARLTHAGTFFVLPALAAAALIAVAPLAPASAQSAMSSHAAKAEEKADSVEERITDLHASLKITAGEETAWQAVAQTMRDNAAAMEKLASSKESKSDTMTAVEDLQTYSDFAQAHVDHLKKLTSAFETLYNAMPAEQKKLADQVFSRSQRESQGKQG